MKPPDERCYEQPLKDDTYVATLSPFTSQAIDEVDNHLTAHELERRMQLITEASRVIDLTEISYVQRSFGGDDDDGNSSNYCHNSNSNNNNNNNNSGNTAHDVSSPDPELLDIVSHRTSSLPETMLRVQQQQLQQQQHQQQQRQSTPTLELIMQNGLIIRLRVIVRKKKEKEEVLLK